MNTDTTQAAQKKTLQAPFIIAMIAFFGGILAALSPTLYQDYVNSKRSIITVHNQLVLPVLVEINGRSAYTKRIEPGDSYTFEILSESEFPARVEWKLIRNRNGNAFIGEELFGDFTSVDKGKELNITNVIGDRTYFYPKIHNNTDRDCFIIVNEGLVIQEKIGTAKSGSLIGISGYYKYAKNSNVTLVCGNVTLWRGEKGDKQDDGGGLKVKPANGLTEVYFP